jgi:transposase InsO family protein
MRFSIEEICKEFKVSRQSYYKFRRRKEEQGIAEGKLIDEVLVLRKRMPMLGGRKLYYLLKREKVIPIGRDKFFELLKRNELLIKPKRYRPKTTESRHRFRKYDNLIKDMQIDRINQVHVADITYLRTVDRFVYLFLITDLYSRRVLGEELSNNLSLESTLKALEMVEREVINLEGSIHHSDRGIQYCSNIYTEKLKSLGMKISMSEQANPYENAVAERINGILKQEFMLDVKFQDIKAARKAVKEAIKIYNEERPHMSLGFRTPEEVYTNGTGYQHINKERKKVAKKERNNYY